jgi:hypothetical protein
MLNGKVSVRQVDGVGLKLLGFHFQSKAHLFCPVLDEADFGCLRVANLANSWMVANPDITPGNNYR